MDLQEIESKLNTWEENFKKRIKKKDPLGHCALYCSSSKDKLYSWMYAFGCKGGY